MKKIWLPQTLYQLLPLLYLLSGLLMLAMFSGDPLGRISGLLLCTAAVLVWVLRVHGRSHKPARRR